MSTIIYKRLFEVRILHDYYLSREDLTSFYALGKAEKVAFLNAAIYMEQYDIRNYLDIIPSASTNVIFENYHLHMVMTPSGFILGAKIKPRLNGAGEEEYLPAIALTGALTLGFHLKIKNPDFNNYTNLKIRRPAPAHYFFSNANEDGTKEFPSLSLPTADFRTGKTYEPGELAVIGGALQEALEETASNDSSVWRPVAGKGLANEQDRLLLPKLFPYTVPEESSTEEFTLKKQDGTEIKKVVIGKVSAFQTFYLDFRQTTPVPGGEPEDIIDGLYMLEISSDGSTETMPIYLSDELHQSSDAGALVIKTDVIDPAFRILNADGTLITRKKADGTHVPHPVYEIRFKRRGTYWRYRSDSGGPLKATTETQPFLNTNSGDLITKDLRPLTYYPTFFKKPSRPEVYLPNPDSDQIKKESKKYFSDLYLSPIKGLIELE